MVDRSKVYTKIQFLKMSLKRLEELKQHSQDEFLENFTYFDSAKYNLIVAIEAIIDICNHIISRENLEVPSTSADSIKILVKHGVIPAENQGIFVAMVKFRNKAVHLYDEIKDEEVYRILQEHLGDFDRFVEAILGYMMGR